MQRLHCIIILGVLLCSLQPTNLWSRQETPTSAALIAEQQRQLDVIAQKVAKIPIPERQRVVHLIGSDPIKVAGDDSCQNEYIRTAGGLAPQFGSNGDSVPVSLAQWQQFNPQVIYSCGASDQILPALQQPGWRDVDAVRYNRILFFPCEPACRSDGGNGTLVSALAAGIYNDSFSNSANYVLKQEIVTRKPLQLDLDTVQKAELIISNIKDFRHKTLAVTLTQPMRVISTLEGQKDHILTVANHYFPPPSWGLGHGADLHELRETAQLVLGLDPDSTAMLFTGADMDNLAVVKKSFQEMTVIALVTAGVEGNSMRMGTDTGSYYELEKTAQTDTPGTINVLLLTNTQLSPRAMSRAIISATEAKSAALQDMDIRSSYSGLLYPATGTGTDNIIVVEGMGPAIDATGGHTKMGELISRAVYDGVQEAIDKQNDLTINRSIVKRLQERKINLAVLCHANPAMKTKIERLLLEPRNASFLAAALTLSDDYERGLITDLSSFELWCKAMADTLGGGQTLSRDPATEKLPVVIGKALSVFLGAASSDTTTAINKFPQRIISLGPINTENIYLLGAEDRLVANTSYCIRPEAARQKEKIGSVMQISIEKILSLQPDLILATDLSPPQQLQKLRDLGLKVVQFHQATSFQQICDQFIALGQLLGTEDLARTVVAQAQDKVAAVKQQVAGLPRQKVFLQIGTQPLVGALQNTFTNDFILLGGGMNIIDDQSSGKTKNEKVIAQNPDVIIIAIMGNESGLAGQEKQKWQAIPVIKAVQDKRVHVLDPYLACSPSPTTFAQTLSVVSRLIHPELNQMIQP